MDPEQVRARMNATRGRIDRQLDRLEARVTGARGPVSRLALGSSVLIALFGRWVRWRHARRRGRQR